LPSCSLRKGVLRISNARPCGLSVPIVGKSAHLKRTLIFAPIRVREHMQLVGLWTFAWRQARWLFDEPALSRADGLGEQSAERICGREAVSTYAALDVRVT
jgi:hypothetical protein